MELGTTIIIAFVVAWVIQYGLTFLQMRRYNKRLAELRKDGTTSIGMSGSTYKRKVYAVLVIDDDEKVLHAEELSGWTVFASLKPVDGLVGRTTNDIMDESIELPIKKKLRSAFQSAVGEIEKARQKTAEKEKQAEEENISTE